jgi:hypothetical protein
MALGNETNITPPRVSLIDERTGAVSREWYRWFYSLFTTLGSGTGIIPVISGGTGLGTIPTNGQLLIGNGTGYSLNTLGTSAGISVTNGLGTITVANTGVLSNIAGTGISVSGATGNVTITNTGVLSFSAGTTGLTPATATTGVVTLAGKLVIANGGTNSVSTPTAGAVPYGTGTAYAFTAAGTAGQVLTSAGASVPIWTTPATGTVTSVSFTGGIVSVATATTTPALTVAGTSGGVVYFSSGTTWASSAALAANALVIGGGAGVAPSTTTTGTGVVTALGTNVGTAGAFVVNGGALGTPSSGTVTNLTGTASININGTVGATTTNTGSFTSLTYSTTLTGGTGIVNLGSGQFYKDASGNIGVGTTSPSYPVVVSRADTTSTIGGSSASMHILNTDSGAYGRLSELVFNLVNQTSGSALAVISGQYATYGGSYGGNLLFSTNPGSGGSVAERLRITSAGSVGIGTTSPSTQFHVAGASAIARIDRTADASANPELQLTAVARQFNAGVGGATFATAAIQGAYYIYDATATEYRFVINTSGSVGIGTSSPSASAILDAQSTTKGVRMPNMTTTQKNAISSPAAGLMVFDTTLAKLCVYSGAAWETVTSI